MCVLTSWALDKRKVVKPAPTAALRVHHCQGREHPSVRETWCVSESETPPRGGRDAVGRIRRLCVPIFAAYGLHNTLSDAKRNSSRISALLRQQFIDCIHHAAALQSLRVDYVVP